MIERLRGAVRAIGRRGSRMARALRRAFGRWVARLRGALPAPAAAPVLPEQWIDGVFTDPAQPGHPLPYKLFVPAGPALPPRPLLLMLHGCLQDPADFAAGTRMNDLAHAHGCLVLYPAQSARANGQRCWRRSPGP